ncbi:GPP34 family phosphoprotein [Streptomyces sp. NPDC059788]|uniref:GOLPH3/VPS74 family protein n=1 Tax=Streptomyces sp. NPDC059788 TaxID=3346948 RepID=UPI00366A2E71
MTGPGAGSERGGPHGGAADGAAGDGPGRGPTLPEDLLLLALDPERGKPLCEPAHLRYGLAGAALAELAWAGRVGEGRGGRIAVLSPLPLGDPLLDGALAALPGPAKGGQGGEIKARRWLRSAAHGIDELCRQRLEQRGAIRRESRRALGIFRYERLTAGPVDLAGPARARFKGALAGAFADPRDRTYAALVAAVHLDRKLTPGRDQRSVRRTLKRLVREDWIARAVQSAVQYDEAANAGG